MSPPLFPAYEKVEDQHPGRVQVGLSVRNVSESRHSDLVLETAADSPSFIQGWVSTL